ncbi:MAG: cytochrome c oxidase subunit I [Dehalococcoidia bacterium]|nr:cytochrome c oxidase subunit I [Dehalococcoidia bacterium]
MASIAVARRESTFWDTVWGWVTTVDHKRIGALYGITAFIFFMIGGVEATLMRMQLARPEQTLVSPDVFNQLFSMHGTTMIFLAIMPLGAAFFNIIIPLQVGARDVAFPRLNAFSYWTFLAGGLLLNSSWFLGGGLNAGWFAYSPLTGLTYNPGHGVDFWAVSLLVLGTASMAAAFNFIVTIVNMRAPGMSLTRMPVFTWMTLIVSILIVTAFPVITVALIELVFDRAFGFNFFNVFAGGDPLLWQHLFWVFGHPEVYILILPAMGIVSEVLPVFSRKPLFGYPFIIFSGIAIGVMGWMVWAHHMFTVGMGPVANTVFTLTTITIAVPTGVKIFNWVATVWGGQLTLKTPMLFSLGFIAMFIIGGLSGLMHAVSPSDAQQSDTYFIVAHIHYVLFGGAIFAIFSGIYYWFPKATGRLMNETSGKIHFWLTMIGFNLTFFPMHFVGLNGMPRRIATYSAGMGWDFWNMVETVGAFVIIAGILLFLHNFFRSLRKGEVAGNDPWDGRTLEWAIPSPPPEYNFERIPVVHSRDPFWEQKHPHPLGVPAGASQQRPGNRAQQPAVAHAAETHEVIHIPSPSYWPLITALGNAIAGYSLVYRFIPGLFIGGALTMFGLYSWYMEPTVKHENKKH